MSTSAPEDVGPPKAKNAYPWVVVGLLWFCGFFNYADRQAVNSVFPLLQKEYSLSNTDLATLIFWFMIVYAICAPFAGFLVDRLSRKTLIVGGLAFWSFICAATGLARSFGELKLYRAFEGFGEAFYFPATMSILADYHGPRTRSRAMSLHQTSVYAGIALGGTLAGYLAEYTHWRVPFYFLGTVGCLYSIYLVKGIVEPPRGASELSPAKASSSGRALSREFFQNVLEIVTRPASLSLLIAFAFANSVTMSLVSWMPKYVLETYDYGIGGSSAVATFFMQVASFFGAILGGLLADKARARFSGGRMAVQGLGVLAAAPCVVLVGLTRSPLLLIASLAAIGLAKGVYEANIFASMYDVIRPELRGFAAGLLNFLGWTVGSGFALLIGYGSDLYGLGASIAACSLGYVLASGFCLAAASFTKAKPNAEFAAEL